MTCGDAFESGSRIILNLLGDSMHGFGEFGVLKLAYAFIYCLTPLLCIMQEKFLFYESRALLWTWSKS